MSGITFGTGKPSFGAVAIWHRGGWCGVDGSSLDLFSSVPDVWRGSGSGFRKEDNAWG